jgi:hypothetical protein
MESTIVPFVRKSLAVNVTLLEVFNTRLGLPEGALSRRHTLEEYSGSEARCIRSPQKPDGASPAAIGAHSDFGSLVSSLENIPGEFANFEPCDSLFFTIVLEGFKYWFLGLIHGSSSK